ncbi:MAG: response regulator transcription factor [Actinomycetota bacterium]|nr:response regulator transcription factor [Actinomycetota bacterium]
MDSPTGCTVLVVDDDATVCDVVVRYLQHAGMRAGFEGDGSAAIDRILAEQPDLVVLDLMLPGTDGLEVFRRVRAELPIPVIFLTALGDEADRLVGLELGADDYVTKPFSPRELVLRVQSVLRRARGALPPAVPSAALSDGNLRVDVAAHDATLGGAPLSLTAREFDLLVFLLQHPRNAFSRQDLLRQVWGWEYADHSTVTVHVRRLREKVERDPRSPSRIVTVFGVGYRYEPQEQL